MDLSPVERYLTTSEVASILRTTSASVSGMVRRGDLSPSIRAGRRYLIPESTLRAYLKDHEVPNLKAWAEGRILSVRTARLAGIVLKPLPSRRLP